MISLERAAQCIGRQVRVTNDPGTVGTVMAVDELDVFVKLDDLGSVRFLPKDLTWVSMLSSRLAEAIEDGENYQDAQVGYAVDLEFYTSGGDIEQLPGLGVVYSTGTSNDNGEHRPLFAVAPFIRRVQLLSITANQNIAWEIEELLGWAEL